MLRFNLFGFPVAIHWSFWITAAMLSGLLYANTPEQFQATLLAVAVVGVSILWHELGHTFFMRRFGGGRPNIYLYWLGGLASTQTSGFSDKQRLVIAAAGPGAGFILAALFYFAFTMQWHLQSGLLFYALWTGLYINVVWSILNLIPVYPLDGGQIMEAALGGRNPRLVYQISFLVAITVAIGVFVIGPIQIRVGDIPLTVRPTFFAIILGFLAYENYQRMNHRTPRSPW